MKFYEGTPKVTQFFFMDWFGNLLAYSEEKGLHHVAISSRKAGNLFSLVAYPFNFPVRVELRQKNRFPEDIPEMSMQNAGRGFVCFQSFRNNKYLQSNRNDGTVLLTSPQVLEWESFLPLTAENFRSLLLLTHSNMAEIKTIEGEVVPPLTFALRQGRFGPIVCLNTGFFPLCNNLEALTKLYTLTEGQTVEIILIDLENKERRFQITGKATAQIFAEKLSVS